jgi:transcriptional regulator with XRE-family HTH domain
MARAALRIGVRALAELADVSAMTITRFENGQSGGQAATLRKLQISLESKGIEFTNGDMRGVCLKRQ